MRGALAGDAAVAAANYQNGLAVAALPSQGLSYALLDVYGATITGTHLRASTVRILRRRA